MKSFLLLVQCLVLLLASQVGAGEIWTTNKANAWYRGLPWLAGCNFSPASAINQLEMWQAETFDPAGIDRELGYAESIGFNSVRVFLHDLLWQQDSDRFLERMNRFLEIADRHHIGTVFVLFDGVWDPFPALGKQREPKAHVHNSGWVQSPGLTVLKNPHRHASLESYVKGVLTRFKSDKRVHAWDLFNEPENPNTSAYGKVEAENKAEIALVLLKKVYAWSREINPDQPLTMGVWLGNWGDPAKLTAVERFMLDNSDLVSFHNYGPLDEMKKCVQNLRRYNRPILCTEYMARPRRSTFDPILGFLKEQQVAAYNWGFVAGKSQTIYPWDTWKTNYTSEPKVWFHDIFRQDGTPFDQNEVEYIKSLTKGAASPRAAADKGNNFRQKIDSLNSRLSAAMESGSPTAFAEYAKDILALEREYPTEPDVYAGLIKLAAFMEGSQAEMLARRVRDSEYAAPQARKESELTLKKLLYVGKPLDLKFKSLDGKEIDLQQLKGKVVLLDVWATWCPPCVQEMPHLKRVYEKLHARGFEIVGISLDRDEKALRRFVSDNKIPWPQRFDGEAWENSMAPKLGLVAIPALWLVDKQGTVRYVSVINGLEEKIASLLAET